jgi:hypothetical protein
MTAHRLLATLALTTTLACSAAGTKSPQGGGGSTASAGSGGGSFSGIGGATGQGGQGNILGGLGGASDGGLPDGDIDGAICSANTATAQPVPLDLYVLMDSSKSMLDAAPSGGSKWDGVKTAMSQFFADNNSAGLGVGLKFFPGKQTGVPETCSADNVCGSFGPCQYRKACLRNNTKSIVDGTTVLCTDNSNCASNESCVVVNDCGTGNSPCVTHGTGAACTGCTPFAGYCQNRDICSMPANYYAMPDVAVGNLPGAATSLNAALTAQTPGGYTPTGPALSGALDFARTRLSALPEHRIAVVLVTDGLPGGFIPGRPNADCTPADIPGIAAILGGTKGAKGAPPVLTFVIGVFDNTTAGTAQTNLNMLASAGGTSSAVIVNTGQSVTQQLQDALKQVQSKAIACEYKVPATGVDFNKVNVTFTSGSNKTPVGHLPSNNPADCDARGGWYYDKNPPQETPTSIKACPKSCELFQTDVNGQVNIALGCPTIDVG